MRWNRYLHPIPQRLVREHQGSQRGRRPDHESRWFIAPRPYIIRLRKRHNYRNIISRCLLTVLGSSTIGTNAPTPRNKPRSPRSWTPPPPIVDEPQTKSSRVCTGSFLSTNSREEQASAPTEDQPDHNAEDKPHVSKALNIDLTGTSVDVTKTLSVDAKVFRPLTKLNVNAPIYDPFGNAIYHESPNQMHNLPYWESILIEDGLIDGDPKRTNRNKKGLTVNTSAAWTAEEICDHTKYTPTMPNPSSQSPIYQPPTYESPMMHNGYNYASPESYSGSTSWSNNVQTLYYPTNHDDFEMPPNTEDEEETVSERESVKTTPASPCVNQPVRSEPTQALTRLNDTGSVSKGNKNTVNIMNCNAHGWNSSIKIESTIQMMATKDIHVCTLQETWSKGDWEKEIRGYLVIHHNYEERDNDWSNKGRERRGVAIILSPMFKKAYKRAGRPTPITTPLTDADYKGRFIGVSVSFPNADSYGKRVKGENKFFIGSAYHPFEEELYDGFNDLLTSILAEVPTNTTMLIGHDINANLGVRQTGEENTAIGPHGIASQNEKGCAAVNFFQSMNLKVLNTFYQHDDYVTWTNPASGSQHMLDIWTTNNSKKVTDCHVWKTDGILSSDHSAVIAKITLTSIKNSTAGDLYAGEIDWKEIRDNPAKNKEFNEKVRSENHSSTSYTEFYSLLDKAARETATKPKRVKVGWYELSRDIMEPLVSMKNVAMERMRSVPSEIKPLWREKVKDLTKQIKDQAEIAKAKWNSKLAHSINDIKSTPKEAWKCLRDLEAGVKGHHVKPITMKMKMENGELANSDKENMAVFSKHLNRVYNTQRPKYQDAAKLIAQRRVMTEMGDDVSWEEFNQAVTKLQNDKSPGENGIPPNAFKCLDSENRTKVYKYICAFWNEEMDYEEWHSGLVKLLPKSGDLSDPNKWRGITLMDVCSKIFSAILTARAQKLLSKCGIKQQFGGTPLVGCADGQFVLKTLLHLRHQHNLPTYVMFVDLVKAYDTVDHELLFEILERYGAHPKFVNAIRRLYDSLIAKVAIGSERTEIEQTVGVRQGDNLSPVLFLFVMSAFAESLDDALVAYDVEKTKFKRVSTENFNQGQLIGHKPVTYATANHLNRLKYMSHFGNFKS